MVDQRVFTVTNVIIVLTLFMYVVQTNIEYGTAKLGLNFLFIEYGLWYQPLSTIFAHGGVGHLLMNMFVLYQFGNMIELYRGRGYFFALYFLGGLLTSLFSFAFIYYLAPDHNLVGASGAICVLLGYIALIDKTQRKGMVIWIVLISLAPLLIGLHIAWYAHFIGFAIGWLFGMLKR